MASASKFASSEKFFRTPCHEILHPWTKSCFVAAVDMFLSSVAGAGTFFALMYIFQYIINSIKDTKDHRTTFKDLALKYVRSAIFFGASEGTIFIMMSCVLRKVLGRFYVATIIPLPAILGGLTIGFAEQNTKLFFTNVVCNMALQTATNQMQERGWFQWRPLRQTALFMVINALLSGLLYRFSEDKDKPRCFWIFMPLYKKYKVEAMECWHQGTCRNLLSSGTLKYFIMGLLLQCVKAFFSKARVLAQSPSYLWRIILNPHLYRLAAFLGFYYAIYQSVKCITFQRNKSLTCTDEMLAGMLAGAAFVFQPSKTIFNSALISTIQMATCLPAMRKLLPCLPYPELCYALCNGYLFYCRAFDVSQLSKLMSYAMSTVTSGRCDYIVHNLNKRLISIQ